VIDEVWDPGLQNERTRLAWQRTTLAGLVCGLVVARLLSPASLVLAVTLGLAAVINSALLARLAAQRYASNQASLHTGQALSDARAHLGVTTLVIATGAGALLYVLIR
jgi:putative membrane protein